MTALLEWILWIAIIFGAAPYVLGPLLVRAQQRHAADPRFEPFDAARHVVPAELGGALERTVTALEGEGFARVADLYHASEALKTVLRVTLLAHAESGVAALAAAAWGTNPKVPIRITYVEFAVKFTDQRSFSVHNSPQPDVYAPHPEKLTARFPQVRDPSRLWRVSRELLRRRYGSIARAPFAVSDPAGFVAAAMVREYRQQVETGYLFLDEAAGAFRPTWRGAWRMTWKLLPPMSQVHAWLARRRAAGLLEELGLHGPDPRPVPVGLLRDPMRWNFVMMLGAAALLWLGRGTVAPLGTLPAGFTVPADFDGAVRALESLAGDSSRPLVGVDSLGRERPTGARAVRVRAGRAEGLVRGARDAFLRQGFFLYLAERSYGIGSNPDVVALFPGADPYAILPLVGTNAWNYGFGPDSIVTWLRALERDEPFVLTGIGFDWIEGRFTGDLGDADALARRFAVFCPDVVDQGTGTVAALARELKKTKVLYCWWD